jgi:hypothetical protein
MRRDPALSFGHRRSLRPIGPGPGRGTCASALPKLTMRVRLPSPAPHHIRAPVGGSARYAGEAQIGRRARSRPSWRPGATIVALVALVVPLGTGELETNAVRDPPIPTCAKHAGGSVPPGRCCGPCAATGRASCSLRCSASQPGQGNPPSHTFHPQVRTSPCRSGTSPCPGLTVQHEADRLLGSSPASCPGGDPERRGPTGRNDRQTPPLDGRQVLFVVAISL